MYSFVLSDLFLLILFAGIHDKDCRLDLKLENPFHFLRILYAKEFHRSRQGKTVGWNHAGIGLDIDKAAAVEILRVDNRRVDVGEDLELA